MLSFADVADITLPQGSRFASTKESPLAEPVKQAFVQHSENDTIYGKNFDGLYARVLKTPAAQKAMKRPVNPIAAALGSFKAAKMIDLPLWKVRSCAEKGDVVWLCSMQNMGVHSIGECPLFHQQFNFFALREAAEVPLLGLCVFLCSSFLFCLLCWVLMQECGKLIARLFTGDSRAAHPVGQDVPVVSLRRCHGEAHCGHR